MNPLNPPALPWRPEGSEPATGFGGANIKLAQHNPLMAKPSGLGPTQAHLEPPIPRQYKKSYFCAPLRAHLHGHQWHWGMPHHRGSCGTRPPTLNAYIHSGFTGKVGDNAIIIPEEFYSGLPGGLQLVDSTTRLTPQAAGGSQAITITEFKWDSTTYRGHCDRPPSWRPWLVQTDALVVPNMWPAIGSTSQAAFSFGGQPWGGQHSLTGFWSLLLSRH